MLDFWAYVVFITVGYAENSDAIREVSWMLCASFVLPVGK